MWLIAPIVLVLVGGGFAATRFLGKSSARARGGVERERERVDHRASASAAKVASARRPHRRPPPPQARSRGRRVGKPKKK